MNKEEIEKRVSDLRAHRDLLLAELNQVEGALMDCEYWKKEIEKKESGREASGAEA